MNKQNPALPPDSAQPRRISSSLIPEPVGALNNGQPNGMAKLLARFRNQELPPWCTSAPAKKNSHNKSSKQAAPSHSRSPAQSPSSSPSPAGRNFLLAGTLARSISPPLCKFPLSRSSAPPIPLATARMEPTALFSATPQAKRLCLTPAHPIAAS